MSELTRKLTGKSDIELIKTELQVPDLKISDFFCTWEKPTQEKKRKIKEIMKAPEPIGQEG